MNEKIFDALEKAKPPTKHELGGGIYYTCYWLKCSTDLKKWYRYCPGCGTKIAWSDAYVDDSEKPYVNETPPQNERR